MPKKYQKYQKNIIDQSVSNRIKILEELISLIKFHSSNSKNLSEQENTLNISKNKHSLLNKKYFSLFDSLLAELIEYSTPIMFQTKIAQSDSDNVNIVIYTLYDCNNIPIAYKTIDDFPISIIKTKIGINNELKFHNIKETPFPFENHELTF